MITGASQADGAVLIIDALEGVRDQTRRHGYLLHLLGVKQVAVVVNKMDRVDFSAARFQEISDEISAHLDRPWRDAPGGDSDFGARRRTASPSARRTSNGTAAHRGGGARCAGARRGPLQQRGAAAARCRRSNKFDDRRSFAGASNPCSLAAGDESSSCRGQIARIRSVEGWPVTPVTENANRRPVSRHHARPRAVIERGDVIAHVGSSRANTSRISRPDLLAA